MHTLKPVLVLVKEGKKKMVVPVDPADCREGCSLEGEEEWSVYTHLRAHLSEEKYAQLAKDEFVQLALMVDPSDGGEEFAQKCTVTISSSSEINETELKWSWFHDPVWERDYFIQPDSENISRAGTQYIHISTPDGKKTVRLLTHPSGLTDEDYQMILEDISRIHTKLLMGVSTKSVVVGERWEVTAMGIERHIGRMRKSLQRLEAAPQRDLVARRHRVPDYKIKKFTPKTVVDRAMGRPLLRTDIHEESADIYEHRVIRTHLEKLKKLVDNYRMGEIRKAGKPISEENLANVEKKLEERLQKICKFRKMDTSHRMRDIDVTVEEKPEWDTKNGKLSINCLLPESVHALSAEYRSEYEEDGAEARPGRKCHLSSLTMDEKDNKWQIRFLEHCIQKVIQEREKRSTEFTIKLSGDFVYHFEEYPEDDVFIIKINYLDRMSISDRELSFKEQMIQYVRDRELLDEELISLVGEYDQPERQKKVSERITKIQNKCSSLNRQIDELMDSQLLRGLRTGEQLHTSNLFAKDRNYHQAYRQMLEMKRQFAAIDLWQAESRPLPVEVTWHIYEVWCLFKMLLIWIDDYSFTLTSHSGSIEQLIEQIHQHWLQYNERKKEDARDPIKIKLRMDQGNLKGMTLELDYNTDRDSIISRMIQEKLAGMTLELNYDKNHESIIFGKIQKKLAGMILRPDFFLTISYGGKTCKFCMDAKYRNYSEKQQKIEEWYKDVFGVAWFKYIYFLSDKINGSYILHSDTGEYNVLDGQNIGRYFWSELDRGQVENDATLKNHLVSEWKDKWDETKILEDGKKILKWLHEEQCKKNEWDEEKILKYLYEELRKVEDCQLGSVCFTPLGDRTPDGVYSSDAAFRRLMQMIMEHFFGVYRSKCWICGSEDLSEPPDLLLTRGRKAKYFIYCKNEDCNEHWVQTHCLKCGRSLGKHHPVNYYRTEGGEWQVRCPSCGTDLENEES